MGLDLPSKKRASKGPGFFILRGVCTTERRRWKVKTQ